MSATDLARIHDQMMTELRGFFLPAGTSFSVRLAATHILDTVQEQILKAVAAGRVEVQQIESRITAIRQIDADRGQPWPPDLGDAEITIAGVPRLGGSAAEAIGSILKGLAAVGASVALVEFTTKSDNVPEDVQKTASAIGTPIIIILLILLFLLKEWNKT